MTLNSVGKLVLNRQDAYGRSNDKQLCACRLLFDEERHELRANESSHAPGYIVGMDRWLPRLSVGTGYSASPPVTSRFAERIAATANAGGWTYHPVVLPFQVTRHGVQFLQTFTPKAFRQLTPTQFWGVLYPLTYVLAFAWLFGIDSPALQTTHHLWLFVLISIVWWGVGGLLAWALPGFPKFWREKRSSCHDLLASGNKSGNAQRRRPTPFCAVISHANSRCALAGVLLHKGRSVTPPFGGIGNFGNFLAIDKTEKKRDNRSLLTPFSTVPRNISYAIGSFIAAHGHLF